MAINTEVIANSHTDSIFNAYDAVACSWSGDFVVAQDLLVITIDEDGTISQAQADVCGSCPDYPWPTAVSSAETLAPSKYDGPLAQFNDQLKANIIPHDVYAKCNYPPPG